MPPLLTESSNFHYSELLVRHLDRTQRLIRDVHISICCFKSLGTRVHLQIRNTPQTTTTLSTTRLGTVTPQLVAPLSLSIMNFTSLIHGDIGTTMCDSLLLHELASLSRVSTQYRGIVNYKYSHMKYLDLGASPNISLENFARLCSRLRGIEVLLIPLNHMMLVKPDPGLKLEFDTWTQDTPAAGDTPSASSITVDVDETNTSSAATSETTSEPVSDNPNVSVPVEAVVEEEDEGPESRYPKCAHLPWQAFAYASLIESTNGRGIRELFSLINSNSSTLRVFRLSRIPIQMEDVQTSGVNPLITVCDHTLLLADFFSNCVDQQIWKRLEVLELYMSVDLTRCTPHTRRLPFEQEILCQTARTLVMQAVADEWTSIDRSRSSIVRLAQISLLDRVLTPEQYRYYEELAANEGAATNNSSALMTNQLRVAPSDVPLTLAELKRWVLAMPYLETFSLWVEPDDRYLEEEEEDEKEDEKEDKKEASVSIDRDDSQPPLGIFTLFHLTDGIKEVPLWSNLLTLRLMELSGIEARRLEFRLPQLLQLTLDDRSSQRKYIEDIYFECPRLIALRLCIPWRASEEMKHKLGIKANILVNSQGMEEEEDATVATPPSLFTSMRGSPHIRNLNCLNYGLTKMDYSHYLTQEEMQLIREKAKSLGYHELSKDADESKDHRVYRTRLFYYALSLLPCAATLEMIEFAPEHISLDEYLALFPHLRGVSQVPIWFSAPIWYRPPEAEDESHFLYLERRIKKEYTQRADRMHTRKEANQLTQRDHPPVSILNLCSADITLTLATTTKLSTTPLLVHLRSLFLSAPTVIESSQVVTQLFLSCQQLEHASLMQLEGIDNTVFTQLPADCVRSSLVTLRIKTPCGVEPSNTFNEDLLTRDLLPQLFPNLRRLEYLLIYRPSENDSFIPECLTRLSDILSPSSYDIDSASSSSSPFSSSFPASSSLVTERLLWPSLSYLSVRIPQTSEGDGEYAADFAQPLGRLARIFARRFKTPIPDSSMRSILSSVPTLALVLATNIPLMDRYDYNWNLPQRFSPTLLRSVNSSMRTLLVNEHSCVRAHCHYHTKLAQQRTGRTSRRCATGELIEYSCLFGSTAS